MDVMESPPSGPRREDGEHQHVQRVERRHHEDRSSEACRGTPQSAEEIEVRIRRWNTKVQQEQTQTEQVEPEVQEEVDGVGDCYVCGKGMVEEHSASRPQEPPDHGTKHTANMASARNLSGTPRVESTRARTH